MLFYCIVSDWLLFFSNFSEIMKNDIETTCLPYACLVLGSVFSLLITDHHLHLGLSHSSPIPSIEAEVLRLSFLPLHDTSLHPIYVPTNSAIFLSDILRSFKTVPCIHTPQQFTSQFFLLYSPISLDFVTQPTWTSVFHELLWSWHGPWGSDIWSVTHIKSYKASKSAENTKLRDI